MNSIRINFDQIEWNYKSAGSEALRRKIAGQAGYFKRRYITIVFILS